jgi:ABC transport system ATP-binding/permease protein
MPLISIESVAIAYGHLPLLDDVALQIESGERIALIGRNGTGKSTLLKIVSGEQAADAGTVWRQPAIRIARLEQDVPLSSSRTVFEIVAEGHTSQQSADAEDEVWRREHQVDQILSRLNLPAAAIVDTLSGGWRRRVLLARALVGQPDLLLLDEPTNYIDTQSAEVVQTELEAFTGCVVAATHDRYFLETFARRIVELAATARGTRVSEREGLEAAGMTA